ncbi:hypothetical protein QAD02_000937 [Eretmocerus hayati]|uniref:Uncharacterized protein n=1 Tax=Eretmocerus hayati TaxID=131215 RepID=A0ACC2NFW3_9HYME|nr:hypothetical protein QAD02_000937 [Eretmocerus hayati]
MDGFSKPMIDTMIDLGEQEVEWFNKSQNSIERSIVLAPIASLDPPARAAAQNIDLAIAKIAPPDFTTRASRGLEDRKHWKVSEYGDHTLHYSPILLKDKLPKEYYDHFMLFSNAKRILSQAPMSQDEIDLAEKLNDELVGKFHLLYGEVHCTIYIHQASHMAELVRKWGPYKAKRGEKEFTSSIFKRQKKRLNSMITWNRGGNFGNIRFLFVSE